MGEKEFALCNAVHRTGVKYFLTEQEGREIRDLLKQFSTSLHGGADLTGDQRLRVKADRAWALAKLFE